MKDQKGFSLIELLVVLIIIGIVVAIAIPSLMSSRRMANEASAIQILRTIHSAEITFQSTSVSKIFGNFTTLSGAELLDPTFTGASVNKSGYTIAQSLNGTSTRYCASANPIVAGITGTRIFGSNEAGVVYEGVAAGACATGVLDQTGGTPIQ